MLMSRKRVALAAACSAFAVATPAVVPSPASAAAINDLCTTQNFATYYMWIDGSGGAQQAIPSGATVRILAFRDSQNYTIRYNGNVGAFPRSLINQGSCH